MRACCYYVLIGIIDPTLPPNYGLVRAVETRFREGSLLDPRWPAPVNAYMPTAQVAQVLGIEPAAVRQRVHRARLMLRGYLSDLLGVRP